MSDIRKVARERGSALLIVIVIAAVMAIIAPIMSSYFVSSSRSVAANREAVMKSINLSAAGKWAISPATIYRSWQMSDYGTSSGKVINPCLKVCIEGVDGNTPDWACGNAETDDGTVYASWMVFVNAYKKYCWSRYSDNKPLWHKVTLFLPTEQYGEAAAGPDVHPSSGPSGSPHLRTPVRYTRDGGRCSSGTGTGIGYLTNLQCPVRMEAYFHPICTGDPWDNDLAKIDPPPGTQYAGTIENNFSSVEKVEEAVRKHAENFINEATIRDAVAAVPGRDCLECKSLETPQGTCKSAPTGYTACPNGLCRAYNNSYLLGFQTCCYPGFSCGGIGSTTGNNTGTYTIATGTFTGSSYGNTDPSTYRLCSRARRIMVYVKSYISLGTDSTTATDERYKVIANQAQGQKILDSRQDSVGVLKSAYELQSMRVCGGLLSCQHPICLNVSPNPPTSSLPCP